MHDVSFGQYYPASSFVHKLDPRIKILFLIVYVVAVFMAQNFIALALAAAVFILIVIGSKVPFGSLLRSIKAVTFLLIFTAILNLFFHAGKTVLVSWWIITITQEAVYFTIFYYIFSGTVIFIGAGVGDFDVDNNARGLDGRH